MKRFYNIRLKGSVDDSGDHIILKGADIVSKITYGKKKYDQSVIEDLQLEAEGFISKKYGTQKIMCLEQAILQAVGNKVMELSNCRTYVIHNTKYNRYFENGTLLTFDGERVRMIKYEKSNEEFGNLNVNQWVICARFLISQDGNTILLNDDSTCRPGDNSEDEELNDLFMKLYTLDPVKSKSQCTIGRVISASEQHYNPKGNKYEDGYYVHLRLEIRGSGEDITFRVWSTNVPTNLLTEDLGGKLVLVATNGRKLRDSNIVTGMAVVLLKKFKRKAQTSRKETLNKLPKGDNDETPGTSKRQVRKK